MKRVFLDTNVLLDFILEREGVNEALDILQLGEERKLSLEISFLTIANAAYVIRKGRTKEELYAVMADFVDMFKVLDMTEYQLHNALQIVATDFEDVLQFACAKCHGCDVIVTRNIRHFSFADIPVMTPKEFLDSRS